MGAHDILTPAAFLCKALQEDELCIISAAEAILKATKAIEKFKTAAFEDLPTVKRVLARVHIDKNGTHTYQGVDIVKYDQAVEFLKEHKNDYIDSVLSCCLMYWYYFLHKDGIDQR